MLLGASVGISMLAISEIKTPHHLPAPFTLFIAAGVIAVKETLYRRVAKVGREVGSTAITADAWHHRADAISSLTAFIGIGIALLGGRGWEAADDWAALVAAILIAVNGVRTLRPAISGLMDEAPDRTIKEQAMAAACSVDGVRSIEHLKVRRSGLGLYIDLHVQADPGISLEDAHEIAAKVKYAILAAVPNAIAVLVHMEPYRNNAPVSDDPVLSLPPV
jgi:cation diffusion facilitator family transporter